MPDEETDAFLVHVDDSREVFREVTDIFLEMCVYTLLLSYTVERLQTVCFVATFGTVGNVLFKSSEAWQSHVLDPHHS